MKKISETKTRKDREKTQKKLSNSVITTTSSDVVVKRIRKPRPGQFKPGQIGNPTGKGGFGERPQDRNSGGRPKNQDSITAQYRIMMNYTQAEIDELLKKQKELTMAQRIALARVKDALRSNDNRGLYNTIEITDRTDGRVIARNQTELSGEVKGITVKFIDYSKKDN